MTSQWRPGGLTCQEVLDRLSDYLDGDLPAAERAKVVAHLDECQACARFGGEVADNIGLLREALRGDEVEADAEALRRQVRARIGG